MMVDDGFDFRVMLRPDRGVDEAALMALHRDRPDDRRLLQQFHPLARRRYVVPTPSSKKTYAQTGRLVEQRNSGAMFAGKTRFGKSSTIFYQCGVISKLVPGAVMLSVEALRRHHHRPGHAYTDVARALKLPMKARESEDHLLERVVYGLWMKAAEADSEHLVIAIDEAQRYDEAEYDGLMTIDNILAVDWEIRTTSLLWGQKPLSRHREALLSYRDDIVERLMPWAFTFDGVRSQGELHEILQTIQDKSEFPMGSGLGFVEAFLPLAADNGLRIQDWSKPLWDAFMERAGQHGKLLRKIGIGMHWLALGIEDLLTSHAAEDHAKWRPGEGDLLDAVDSSGIISALSDSYLRESDEPEHDDDAT